MAETKKIDTGQGNPVPHDGDHDRVVMLSLHADGTPAQHNPEFIGGVENAKAAARLQFAEQAVSAVDVHERGASSGPLGGTVEDAPQDPEIEALTKKHEAAKDASEKAADSMVDALHKGRPSP